MNDELLDNLILDKALGVLTPEVEALLEAYLADHPRKRASAVRAREAVALAQRALAGGAHRRELPPFPAAAVAQRRQRLWRYTAEAAALAACVALGYLVAARPQPAPVPEPAPLVQVQRAEEPQFWSVSHWRSQVESAPRRAVTTPIPHPFFPGESL